MSTDQSDIAWKVSPREYVRSLDKAYQGERLISKYVTMRDGIKLAVDVHLPGTEDEQKAYPTICVFTPYYRRFAVNDTPPGYKWLDHVSQTANNGATALTLG